MIYNFYMIKNQVNGKCYIGMTKRSIHQRFKEHIRCATKNHDVNNDYFMPFYNAIRKYGMESFTIELLDTKDFENIRDAEIYEGVLIRKHTSMLEDMGYNLNNMLYDGKKIYTDNISAKIKYNNSKNNNPFFGRKHSEETKKLLSEKAKRRFATPQNNPRYGYRYTEEDKEKHRKAKVKYGKPFYADGVLFNTLSEASIKYNLTKQAIQHRLVSESYINWYYKK